MMETAGGAAVVVARSEEGNRELAAALALKGVASVSVPTIRFAEPGDWTAVDGALRALGTYDWAVFTSPRGVRACARRMSLLGVRVDAGRPRFAAVGPSTASALAAEGLEVGYIPERYLTIELGETLPGGAGTRAVLFRADIADRKLLAVLEGRGFVVKDLSIYQTKTIEGNISPERVAGAKLVVFASPSEVRGLTGRAGPEVFARLTEEAVAVCIGPVTADEAKRAGFKRVTAPSESTMDSLVDKVREALGSA